MAKDVDLSSQEWRDIVFENKNKEFGAYTLRAGSVKRHNKAMLITIIVVGALLLLAGLATAGLLFNKEEAETTTAVVQEDLSAKNNAEEEEQEEEQIDIQEPEPEPEVLEVPEVAQQAFTAIVVTEDDKVKEEVKAQDQMKEDNRAISTSNVLGEADLRATVTAEVRQNVVVAEAPKPVEETKVYDLANVEQKPSFKGGEAAMFKWLGEHIQYPPAAAEEGASGKVQVQFIVSKSGKVTNVKVVRGKHPALDKEAVRVVSAMPDWTPGRQNGQPVNVTYILPVNFTLK